MRRAVNDVEKLMLALVTVILKLTFLLF